MVIGLVFLLALAQFLTADLWYVGRHGNDFWIYLNGGEGWLYAPITWYYWAPYRLLPWSVAWGLWYAQNTAACLWLSYLTMRKYTYGWIIVLAFIPIMHWTLGTGNVIPQLAVLCLTPLGTLLAGSVKLYLLGFLVLHAVRSGAITRLATRLSQIRNSLRTYVHTHHAEEKA